MHAGVLPRLFAVTLLTTSTLALAPQPLRAHQPPSSVTRSYYIANEDFGQAHQLGCNQGGRSGYASLYFGQPTDVSGLYGATLFGAQNHSLNYIEEIVKWFIVGYSGCRAPGESMIVGIGTSNSGLDGKSDAWVRNHGRAWSVSVENLGGWANAHYPSVSVYGAYDVEPGFSAFQKANLWMHGYDDDNPGRRPVLINGSADGCSQTSSENTPCNNGWNQFGVWHVAWDHIPSVPFPQIYTNSGSMAWQWQKISAYGHRHQNGRSLFFVGVMSQHGACEQFGGCSGTSNLWNEARDQLLFAINSYAGTANQMSTNNMTDIRWFQGF
jgi:hypothetical protein